MKSGKNWVSSSKGYPKPAWLTDLQLLFNAEDYADYLLKSQGVKRINRKGPDGYAALERDILTLEDEREELALVRSAVAAQKETAEGLRREADGKIREMEPSTARCGPLFKSWRRIRRSWSRA